MPVFFEGRNVAVDIHTANEDYSQPPEWAADLLCKKLSAGNGAVARLAPSLFTAQRGYAFDQNSCRSVIRRVRGDRARLMAQKSGLSAFGISETDASNAMLFSAQTASSIAPARVR